jgi:hypothetical protein
MRWSAYGVAGFARAAGFVGMDLVDAVALALATSHGDDAYHHVSEPGPTVDERGLWGIDVVQYPGLAQRDLFDPAVNAGAAMMLAHTAEGPFNWSPVWRAGVPTDCFAAATGAVAQRSGLVTAESATDDLVAPPARADAEAARAGVDAYLAGSHPAFPGT